LNKKLTLAPVITIMVYMISHQADSNIFSRDFNRVLPYAVRAEGITIFDESGKEYIDGCSGALISSVGHCVEEITDAVCSQLEQLTFAHPSQWNTRVAERAAAAVAELTPKDLDYVFFVSGGSEAVESALKLARQYYVERDGPDSQKHLIIGRWNSYHGATLGAMSVGGNMPRRRMFLPMLTSAPKLPPHYCYRCPYDMSYPACNVTCARELEKLIIDAGAERVAAFIAEPVVGSTVGALVPPDEYWPIVREICNRYDILLIADEIMTGFGRTGRAFGVDHWNVVPDMMAMAKGMGGGYVPAGGVAAGRHIVDVIKRGSGAYMHGFTYNGNPVSAAAVEAVISYIEEHNLIEHAREMGAVLGPRLQQLADLPIVGEVRGIGLMWGVELVADKRNKRPFPAEAHAVGKVRDECMQRGLLIYPGRGMVEGKSGDNFMIAPPLTVGKEGIEKIAGIVEEALQASVEKLGVHEEP
jgi:adenosylmethionine-8-amino-7-oxononanoate aminotransferase